MKTRSIHDNFLYVRNLAGKWHHIKNPTLIFKLEIKKAFDSVCWAYLLVLLHKCVFPTKFRDMLAALLRRLSLRVMLNDTLGHPIKHGCGLRQRDMLSPLLFMLAIDPLQDLLDHATRQGKLHKIGG